WGDTSGFIKVRANNNCGVSLPSSLSVAVLTSFNGTSNSSVIAAVLNKDPMVFPNPAKNVIYVSFDTRQEDNYKIELTDMSGKLLQLKNGVALRGTNRISFDVHNYTNGIYLITIVNNKGERNTMKLIKD